MTISSRGMSPNPPNSSQWVTLSGLAGQYHGASTGDLIEVTIGFRDGSGNWVGWGPQLVASGMAGLTLNPQGAGFSIRRTGITGIGDRIRINQRTDGCPRSLGIAFLFECIRIEG